ncbi:hypothetical protein ABZX51_000681 [Aspergillus tubingensis]
MLLQVPWIRVPIENDRISDITVGSEACFCNRGSHRPVWPIRRATAATTMTTTKPLSQLVQWSLLEKGKFLYRRSDAAASSRAQEQAQVALPAACHCRLALDQPYL